MGCAQKSLQRNTFDVKPSLEFLISEIISALNQVRMCVRACVHTRAHRTLNELRVFKKKAREVGKEKRLE